MIKYLIFGFTLFSLAVSLPAEAQSSGQLAFNQAANLYIDGKNKEALQQVNNALQKYPGDQKLQALKKKLEEQQQQQQQQDQENQKQQDQNQDQQEDSSEKSKDQQNKSEENKDGKEQEEKDKQEDKGDKKEDKEGQEGEEKKEQQDQGDGDTKRRLEEMEMSPEKAKMILEAMKSNEVQYLQQKKRKQSKRPNNSDRPDW